MFKHKYHAINHFIKPLLRQKIYLLSYALLQCGVLVMLLIFAQGKPIWHDVSSRFAHYSNHALIPVYKTVPTHKILSQFELIRQSTLQVNNPSVLLQSILVDTPLLESYLTPNEIEAIYTVAENLLYRIYDRGYIEEELPSEAQKSGYILTKKPDNSETLVSIHDLITKSNIQAFLEDALVEYDTDSQAIIKNLLALFLEQNLHFEKLERHQVEEISATLLTQERLGIVIYILLLTAIIVLLVYYIYGDFISQLHRYTAFAPRYYALILLTFISLFLTFTILVWPQQNMSIPKVMLVPGVVFAFMISFLLGYRNGLLYSLYYIMIFMLATKFDMLSSIYLIITMPFSVYLAARSKTRSQLFFASFWQALLNALVIISLTMSNATEILDLTTFSTALFSGLLVSPIALGISPIIERILNLPTTYRLLDLCNLNATTLRRLQYLAPGTYTHSLNVAILAENACQNIGANGLIARVGSYYHDIGKMENPEYFVENQAKGINKHNQMKANLSAAMIRSHVRIGYEMGKEIGLPQEILDIISQHHGKSLVSFFYMRAKDELSEHDQTLHEADFRYPGPRPRSKESAVVMLVDSVEAASHTLRKPNQNTIAKLVDDIIVHKIDTCELDESPLTLKDISKIKQSLIQSLMGQYHHRIEYPKEQEE